MSRSQIQRVSRLQTLTFSSGTSSGPVSSVADIRDAEWFGLIGSTAFGSSQITFAVSPTSSSDGTFYDLYLGATTQVSIAVSTDAARAYVVNISPEVLAPWPFMRLVSGSTGEAAARTLKLLTK